MTSIEKIKLNKTVPTTLIYKGANCLGKEITSNLIDQGGFVIIIDELSESNVVNYKEFVNSNLFLFIDFVGLDELKNELERLDYIIFIDEIEKDVSEKIGTDFFLKSSNDLNKVLKIALHFKSKFVLASSLKVHQVLLNMQNPEYQVTRNSLEYNRAELQRYSESLVKEFIDKANLNARIVRVAELVGEGVPLNIPSELVRLCKLAINGKKLNLIGDGLQSNYLISVKDAAFGVLKSLFEDKTKGNIYSICYPQEITSLSLAYKITELEKNSGQIVFDDSNESPLLPLNFESSINLSEIGWSPKINLERAISQEIEWINSYYGGKRKVTEKSELVEMEPMKPRAVHDLPSKKIISKKELTLNVAKGDSDNFIQKLSEVTKSKSRNSKIVLSDKLLRDKLKEKEIREHKEYDRTTFSYKFNYWIRTLTLSKIFSYIFIFILSFVLYFLILSPALRSLKNVYEIDRTAKNLGSIVSESDLKKLSDSSSSLITDLENSKFIFDIFRLNDLHNNLRNNFNIVKEYSSNALLVSEKYKNIETYLNSKKVDVTLSQNEYSDLKKLAISNDKLIKDTTKISPTRIEQIDTPVSLIKTNIEKGFFEASIQYISFEENTTLFNAYEENVGYLFLYSSTDTNKVKTISGYSYFNNQELNASNIIEGKFDDKFKLTPELKASLDTLLVKPDLTSSDKKDKTEKLLEYFNTALSAKIDTIIVVNYQYNPNLLGDSTVEDNLVSLDSIKALDKVNNTTDLTNKIAISSKITQNYLSRPVIFSKLTDYLNLFLTGISKGDISMFTNKGI
ncbi:MAG: NAD-dependent epimerase/dehydratase family protein [bacterium]